jgi:hypothetical protein
MPDTTDPIAAATARLVTLGDAEAVATAEVTSSVEQISVAEKAVSDALSGGDIDRARLARTCVEEAKATLAQHESWLAELRAEVLRTTAERDRLQRAADLVAVSVEVAAQEAAHAGAVDAVNDDALTLRSSIQTMRNAYEALRLSRIRQAALVAATTPGVEANGVVHVPQVSVFQRSTKKVDLEPDLVDALMRGHSAAGRSRTFGGNDDNV